MLGGEAPKDRLIAFVGGRAVGGGWRSGPLLPAAFRARDEFLAAAGLQFGLEAKGFVSPCLVFALSVGSTKGFSFCWFPFVD